MADDRGKEEVLLGAVAASWDSSDGVAFSHFFVEDGSLINPFGERADGSAAIGSMYAEDFAGMLAGTSTSVKLETVRPVADVHALIGAAQTVAGGGRVVLAAHLASLLQRGGDSSLLVDCGPSPCPAPPR